ncbi:Xaa-Pro dipeptidase [Thalassotalea sp. PS06]|uniref:Xaa-Pro dipeptidase n=1 Tax=Thalassotalea sp. PS06 TaxID=2594005 RepID=UPI0011642E42|nr:Xaa-Pro dipeptidase [Thalassotalea sp. PS06]QDO99878.1 Xaa-Pro dipeptidase [Thalassotalea sp. PS06]
MSSFASLYPQHIAELQKRTATALKRHGASSLVIHSGQPGRIFLDDMNYPFKCNPHFKHWLPITETPNCWVIANGEDKPTLVFYQPLDFWHKVTPLKEDFWNSHFDIKVISKPDEIKSLLPADLSGAVYIGAHEELAKALGFSQFNAQPVLDYLHYHRAYKTDYELECMRQANKLAVAGHIAAKNCFYEQGSEFDIQLAYLNATGHGENDVPYGNIIALNENAAILHYTVLEKQKPQKYHSFLIDAGASFHGYAADITRTYAFAQNKFAELITAMDEMQKRLVTRLKPGASYVDLHIENHRQLAQLLVDFDFVRLSADQVFEQGVTRYFYPHGLGHHLGLQVHDMGGFMSDENGNTVAAPEQHPFLRTTRGIESKQVFTIEPGLYFIDEFLTNLSKSDVNSAINWSLIDEMKKFGGIRIEDNVIVHDDGIENMTRDLNLA